MVLSSFSQIVGHGAQSALADNWPWRAVCVSKPLSMVLNLLQKIIGHGAQFACNIPLAMVLSLVSQIIGHGAQFAFADNFPRCPF